MGFFEKVRNIFGLNASESFPADSDPLKKASAEPLSEESQQKNKELLAQATAVGQIEMRFGLNL